MNKQTKSLGFTLIELLVVVAIIGLLTSLIAVGFGNARKKSRDAKRLTDMSQIKTGLNLFYSTGGGYPSNAIWTSGSVACNGQQFMETPRDPQTATQYTYVITGALTGCSTTLGRDYYVVVTTEGQSELGPAGTYYMSDNGFTSTAPF